MNAKAILAVAIVAALVSGLNAKGLRSNFEFDCSGLADGNYPHPTLCTHYVACVAQTYAYEMPCAAQSDGSLLHYVASSGPDPTTSRCDYPEVAGCKIGECDAFAKTISAKLNKVKAQRSAVNVLALEQQILNLLN